MRVKVAEFNLRTSDTDEIESAINSFLIEHHVRFSNALTLNDRLMVLMFYDETTED